MVSPSDLAWLGQDYPSLKLTPSGGISGRVSICANYNRRTNRFQILYSGDVNDSDGQILTGTFEISIEKRNKDATSVLPSVRTVGLNHDPHRHISRDGSACLCSLYDEKDFYNPDFSFKSFFEQLVIPFLYGQLHYENEKKWPWDEYSHGSLGILEAYSPARSSADVKECLQYLRTEYKTWARVRDVLLQRNAIKDSTPCICSLSHRMGHCHRRALRGLQQLRSDMRGMYIQL